MAVKVSKMEASNLGKNGSCKSGPKTVVGVGTRQKERRGSRNSKYRPSLREFYCRRKQRIKEAAREEQGSRFTFFFIFYFCIRIRQEDQLPSLLSQCTFHFTM